MLDAGVQSNADLPPEGQPEKEAPPAIVEKIDLDDVYFSGLLKEAFKVLQRNPEAAPDAEPAADEIQPSEVVSLPENRIDPERDPVVWVPHSPYAIPAQAREHRMKSSLDDPDYDGCFFGRGYAAFTNEAPIELIPPVMPNLPEGVAPGEPIIYVNGISTPAAMARWGMRLLADKTGCPVIGIYNATDGDLFDVAQAIGDKMQLGDNPAVNTIYEQILRVAENGGTLRILGDSQGALCVSRSISMVQREMLRRGYSRNDIEERLSRLHIETIGGAAWSYPDGPRYVHYINEYDPIPYRFGLATYERSDEELAQMEDKLREPPWLTGLTKVLDLLDLDVLAVRSPGKNSQVIRFKGNQSEDWVQTHTIDKYLNHVTPFQERPEGPEMKPDTPGAWTVFWRAMKWLGIISTFYCVMRESKVILGKMLERRSLNRARKAAQKELGKEDCANPKETTFNAGLDEAKSEARRLPGKLLRSILSLLS